MVKKKTRSRKQAKRTAKKPAKKAAKKAVRKKVARKKTARKKAAKRTPAKKTAKRKRRPVRRDKSANLRTTSRQRVYNLTKEVPEHHYFVLANGQPVKHVAELASVLDQLEDHVFHHHVTPDRNDFNSWIREVFQDVELAKKITGVADKKHLQLVIYRHLAGHGK